MQSLTELYRIGYGPSSSHTMGPASALNIIDQKHLDATKFVVTLFNSLALTGIGHLTHEAIRKSVGQKEVEILKKLEQSRHPNYLVVDVYKFDQFIKSYGVSSVGGGRIIFDGEEANANFIYPHKTLKEIKTHIKSAHLDYASYVDQFDHNIDDHLQNVWQVMKTSIESGIKKTGTLPGDLKVRRKANDIYQKTASNVHLDKKLIASFAYAVSEENASGNQIVTAPTCGACGVLPAVLYYLNQYEHVGEQSIINALKVAGLFGNLIKHNASISGAVCGCQAEVGSACAMAAAAYAYLKGLTLDQIEYAAEMAIEHHLGLTCDPINGYVQIPCIERNAHAALRAIDCGILSSILVDSRKITFDMVVETMYKTGLDMHTDYKETSFGGLAFFYKEDNDVNCW